MGNIIIKKNRLQLTRAKDSLAHGICVICMVLFFCSAYSKIAEHEAFYRGLSSVKMIRNWAKLISWAVPVAELLISVLLIFPKTYKWGLYGFTILMTVFTVYIVSMMIWADTFPCHCNLFVEKLSWEQHAWFNLGFIGLSISAIVIGKKTI